ncbi:YlmC/YmxH family sporulation protein [Bacillus solimangrovi]|uniref:PRC-barrel domain-containing protein n=1 Tax=Bacillus solimangrovi TaxID=1305675 RepID=A0A1E5LE16_9BACI|nr:YlmC/YmxH family sporulation protein [Bacillus solimangrovi]OEH92310.1 hypothetical protein BFG57_16490 [Bacillus solimangrovi]
MRLSEMSGKEIVDLKRGERLGVLGHADFEIDENTGMIRSVLIPSMKWFGFRKQGEEVTIQWENIKKIGTDMIIIDFEDKE